ncbi:MAG: DoxX family protein [Betaproteobacteria bacterium]|nr:DoxX family protein [Betaproteobacteria bacterium]MBI3938640.1 DoxX family protein [Betaproteobacteria bacterium]
MHAACELVKQYGPLIGRVLLALIFVYSGFGKITGFAGVAGYMAAKGIPLAEVALVLTIIIEVGGGLMLILGWKARWAALAIFLWLIPVTLVFHNFWAVDAAQYQGQFNHFMKNVAIMGGMLYVMAFDAGPLSLEGTRERTETLGAAG